MMNYAHLLIEVLILKKLPKYIHFEDDKGVIQQQGIVFEWKPIIYKKCKKYGHNTDQCTKENGAMVWRPKATQPGNEAIEQPEE